MEHLQQNGSLSNSEGPRGITLVLGGGGARGLAHFGVLEVLEEAGIPIDVIVGNSAGALAGAMYLQCGSASATIERVLEFLTSPKFRRHRLHFKMNPDGDEGSNPSMVSRLLTGWRRTVAMHLLFRRTALFHTRRLSSVVAALVEEVGIEDLPLPLKVVALDLADGDEVVLEKGDLRQAVVASCSVAGFFPPVTIDERRLIDAGQADNLPVQVGLEVGTRPIVAVNLSADMERRSDFQSGIEIMLRSEEIGSRWNTRLRLQQCDVHIAPSLQGRFWLDFSNPKAIVDAGADAARRAIPRIREALHGALSTDRTPNTVRPT